MTVRGTADCGKRVVFGIYFEHYFDKYPDHYPCTMYHAPFYKIKWDEVHSARMILKKISKKILKRNSKEDSFSAFAYTTGPRPHSDITCPPSWAR